MKIAHVILAHSKPSQLERLVKTLVHEDSVILVHIDMKCRLGEYDFLKSYPGVEFSEERYSVHWGGFSLVKAIMSAFRQLYRSDFAFDYVNLISGQDFPIKPLKEFRDFLKEDISRNFIEFYSPGHDWVKETKHRIRRYHFTDFKFKGSTLLETVVNYILPYKKLPSDFEIIGHSGWFTLTREGVKYLIDYFESHRSFIGKFKFSWGSDEFLLQSILYNSKLQPTIVNNNLRYIDWSEGKASPKVLTISDKVSLEGSSSFFARKFDDTVDAEILNHLEKFVCNPYNE